VVDAAEGTSAIAEDVTGLAGAVQTSTSRSDSSHATAASRTAMSGDLRALVVGFRH
jgi:hypothetical protein